MIDFLIICYKHIFKFQNKTITMNIKENFKVSRQLTNYYDNFNKFLLIKHNKICSMTLLHLYLLRNPYRLYDKNLIKLIV